MPLCTSTAPPTLTWRKAECTGRLKNGLRRGPSRTASSPRAPPLPMTAVKTESLKVACSSCNLRELCLPVGFSEPELERLDTLVAARRSLRRGESLFRCGEAFEAVYAVRTGFFKTRVSSQDGRDQVTGFQMAGE